MKYTKDSIKIDAAKVAENLTDVIKQQIRQTLKKSGAVVGISGGIDSSVVAALCVQALGKERVLGVMMPEKESSSDSRDLAQILADRLGIATVVNNIAPALEGFDCYRLKNEAIRRVFPEFTEGWKAKIVIASNLLEADSINYFKLVIESPSGETKSKRMPPAEYMQIVAASNFKQRSRMTHLYYHAERLNWAVVGTGNKDEHELGFFVKYGDGGADLKPIAHLYKLQVYQLAEVLPIPDEIKGRTPTTDTYSAHTSQAEFFFGIDFAILDPIWYGLENNIPAETVANELGLTAQQVERVYKDIRQKQRTTNYLRLSPLQAE